MSLLSVEKNKTRHIEVMCNCRIGLEGPCSDGLQCYALTGCSSRREVSLSGVGSGLSALATCDADMW